MRGGRRGEPIPPRSRAPRPADSRTGCGAAQCRLEGWPTGRTVRCYRSAGGGGDGGPLTSTMRSWIASEPVARADAQPARGSSPSPSSSRVRPRPAATLRGRHRRNRSRRGRHPRRRIAWYRSARRLFPGGPLANRHLAYDGRDRRLHASPTWPRRPASRRCRGRTTEAGSCSRSGRDPDQAHRSRRRIVFDPHLQWLGGGLPKARAW
jgi:hypothetical protein